MSDYEPTRRTRRTNGRERIVYDARGTMRSEDISNGTTTTRSDTARARVEAANARLASEPGSDARAAFRIPETAAWDPSLTGSFEPVSATPRSRISVDAGLYDANARTRSRTSAAKREPVSNPYATSDYARASAEKAASVRNSFHSGTDGRVDYHVGTQYRHRRRWPIAIAIIAALLVIFFAVRGISGCVAERQAGKAAEEEAARAAAIAASEDRVRFLAVGDNLPDLAIGEWADAQAGREGDGTYDYTGLYAPIAPLVQAADLAYVKEETHLGGDDIGPRGYPSFNTTDEMADALVATGFDMVASASNHCYDWGYYGANEHSRSTWNSKNVIFTGTYTTQEEYEEIPVTTVDGIRFALLDYTYGVNAYAEEDLPDYTVKFFHQEEIVSDVERARQVADVVIVSMHWGTEYYMGSDDVQMYWAQFLADLNVDLVLGSHPHVIGPMTWVTSSTSAHRTLVAYSLGDFMSNHEAPSPESKLEGMLTLDFVRHHESGKVGIENVVWTPLVNWTDGTDFKVYALKDLTPEIIRSDATLLNMSDAVAWLRQTSRETVGAQWAFDMGDESSAASEEQD